MDLVLSLSLIFLLNHASLSECVADEAAPTASSSTAAPKSPEISSEIVKETLEKRETCSEASSDASTACPVDEALKPTTAAEEEATSRKPLIIDLGNIPSARLRRSDSDEFTDSEATDGPTGDDSTEVDEVDQESEANAPENVREERNLGSEETLEAVEQARGRTSDGWYPREGPLAERRYWSSEDSRPRRHFITVPIFPGR